MKISQSQHFTKCKKLSDDEVLKRKQNWRKNYLSVAYKTLDEK
jgi:hypothetical protein